MTSIKFQASSCTMWPSQYRRFLYGSSNRIQAIWTKVYTWTQFCSCDPIQSGTGKGRNLYHYSRNSIRRLWSKLNSDKAKRLGDYSPLRRHLSQQIAVAKSSWINSTKPTQNPMSLIRSRSAESLRNGKYFFVTAPWKITMLFSTSAADFVVPMNINPS